MPCTVNCTKFAYRKGLGLCEHPAAPRSLFQGQPQCLVWMQQSFPPADPRTPWGCRLEDPHTRPFIPNPITGHSGSGG